MINLQWNDSHEICYNSTLAAKKQQFCNREKHDILSIISFDKNLNVATLNFKIKLPFPGDKFWLWSIKKTELKKNYSLDKIKTSNIFLVFLFFFFCLSLKSSPFFFSTSLLKTLQPKKIRITPTSLNYIINYVEN